MPESRRSSQLWVHLFACAIVAIAGCSDQSRAGSDAEHAPASNPASVDDQVPQPGADAPIPPAVKPAPEGAEAATGAPSTAASRCSPTPASAYPTDAPYYPAAATVEICRAPDGRIKQVSTTPTNGEQVYVHMTRFLDAQGWSIGSKLAQGGQFALDATKSDRRVAVLIADRAIIQPPDGQTRITVLVTP